MMVSVSVSVGRVVVLSCNTSEVTVQGSMRTVEVSQEEEVQQVATSVSCVPMSVGVVRNGQLSIEVSLRGVVQRMSSRGVWSVQMALFLQIIKYES